MDKQVQVIGGVGEECGWGGQFKQQYRVLDRKKVAYAVNAGVVIALVVRKWRRG